MGRIGWDKQERMSVIIALRSGVTKKKIIITAKKGQLIETYIVMHHIQRKS